MRLMHRTSDSLDQPNAPGPAAGLPDHNYAARRPAPGAPPVLVWLTLALGAVALVIVLALIAVPGWALGQEIAAALADEAETIRIVVRVTAYAGALGVCLIILGVARWLWRRADVAGLVRLPNDAPVLIADLRRHGARLAEASLDAHYDVQAEWAKASQWRGTSTYAPHTSYRYDSRNDTPPALPEPEPVQIAPPLDTARPALEQLAGKGMLRPRALLVGFDSQASAQYIDLALTGMVAVAGQARSGKTTTAIGLMAQAAHQGAALFICDPHGRVDHGLLHKAGALSGRFERQAITDEEIAATVALVAKIARRRLAGLDAADQPVLLVIDEYTALVARRALPEAILADLLAVAVEAPKVKVHGLLLAQDWSARLLGAQMGASLRRVVTHKIVHRSDPGNADFLLPSASVARDVATLTRGQAVYWPADAGPAPLTVPLLATADDLRYAARGAAPRPYAPRPLAIGTAQHPQVTPALPSPAYLTMGQRIKALLADGQPRDFSAIASALGENGQSIQNELTRMVKAGEIARDGKPRNYLYSQQINKHTAP